VRNSKRSNDHQIDQSQDIADEIHCTNMEIFALEMAKSECINRVYTFHYIGLNHTHSVLILRNYTD
jgi:hypothetical protein